MDSFFSENTQQRRVEDRVATVRGSRSPSHIFTHEFFSSVFFFFFPGMWSEQKKSQFCSSVLSDINISYLLFLSPFSHSASLSTSTPSDLLTPSPRIFFFFASVEKLTEIYLSSFSAIWCCVITLLFSCFQS